MKKIIEKIKNYRPPKHICLLYFFIPIFVCALIKIDRESDIWFLLNHGRYVIENGFPTIEPFSMHQNLFFVMQQWLSAVIFYLTYNFLGKYGLLFLVNIVNILILYVLYKLCMKLSDNRFRLSIIISCITDSLLLQSFMLPRPQIFTYLLLLITLYIMEIFIKEKDSKLIYFLPIISFLQINLHASMWLMLFLFILPFFIELIIYKIKDKSDNRIFKLLIILGIMFLVGFINPYGIKNMTYIFTSYGNFYINKSVIEMLPPVSLEGQFRLYFYITYMTIFIITLLYILNKKGKLKVSYMLLLMGVTYLAITSIRNYPLLVIGGIPFLAYNLQNLFPKKKEPKVVLDKKGKTNYISIIALLIVYTLATVFFRKVTFTNNLEEGIDYLLKHNKKEDIVLYAGYNEGSYIEYRGLKPYMDGRAEIYLKANNKKEDILEEYYNVTNNLIDYNEFLSKYKFTHLIVKEDTSLDNHLSKDNSYKVIYKKDSYKIFKRKKY